MDKWFPRIIYLLGERLCLITRDEGKIQNISHDPLQEAKMDVVTFTEMKYTNRGAVLLVAAGWKWVEESQFEQPA